MEGILDEAHQLARQSHDRSLLLGRVETQLRLALLPVLAFKCRAAVHAAGMLHERGILVSESAATLRRSRGRADRDVDEALATLKQVHLPESFRADAILHMDDSASSSAVVVTKSSSVNADEGGAEVAAAERTLYDAVDESSVALLRQTFDVALERIDADTAEWTGSCDQLRERVDELLRAASQAESLCMLERRLPEGFAVQREVEMRALTSLFANNYELAQEKREALLERQLTDGLQDTMAAINDIALTDKNVAEEEEGNDDDDDDDDDDSNSRIMVDLRTASGCLQRLRRLHAGTEARCAQTRSDIAQVRRTVELAVAVLGETRSLAARLSALERRIAMHRLRAWNVTSELDKLTEWYVNFERSYAHLLVELERRLHDETMRENEARAAQERLDALWNAENAAREQFLAQFGQFLPPSLCPALHDTAPRQSIDPKNITLNIPRV